MSGPEALDPQFQIDTMTAILNERLAAASPVEDPSVHSDRILQVMEEPGGGHFVRRSFTNEGVGYVQRSGLSFREAWEGMNDTYAAVGIDIVPSFAFEQEGEHPAVVVSEYVPDAVDVSKLPTDEKVKLMHGLGQLFKPDAEYWPSLEALRADTFKGVEQEDGTFSVLMIDTDPFMIPAPDIARDEYLGEYIKKLSELLWDEWCDDEDRSAVAVALVMSLAESLDEEEYAGMHNSASRAFMNLHLMSNGMDPRGTSIDMLS